MRRVIWIIGFVVLVLAMVWVRVYIGAQTETAKGVEQVRNLDYYAAVHHFDRAVHWYTPFSAPVAESVKQLRELARVFEQRQDNEGALYTWRILRSALYAVRHVAQPYPEVIAEADARIAYLMAQRDFAAGTEPFEIERADRLAQLQTKVGPNTGFALLAEAGFFGWIVCAFCFIWFGIKPEGGIRSRNAALFATLFVVCYGLWILGLAKA